MCGGTLVFSSRPRRGSPIDVTMDVLEIARQHGVGPADWIGDASQEAEISEAEYEQARRRLAAKRRGEAPPAADEESAAPPRKRRFLRSS
jgi:hypothetical protein